MNALQSSQCGICHTSPPKYSCPRCLLPYCSLACYRHKDHAACSEAFYKESIATHLKEGLGSAASRYYEGVNDDVQSTQTSDAESMLTLLRRFEEENAPSESPFVNESIDADELLVERLEGVDLDSIDPEALFSLLPEAHRKAFEEQLKTGEILISGEIEHAVTKPWWIPSNNIKPLVTDMGEGERSDESRAETPDTSSLPLMPFSSLTKAKPHATLIFNLVEILSVYAVVWRHFNGDFGPGSEVEVRRIVLELSRILQISQPSGASFGYEDVEAAVVAVWDQVLRTKPILLNDSGDEQHGTHHFLQQLFADATHLFSSRTLIVAALSHLHSLFSSSPSDKSKSFSTLQQSRLAKKENDKIAKKLFFYACFAADESCLLDDALEQVRRQVAASGAFREGVHSKEKEAEIDVNAARTMVRRKMEEEGKPLVEEIEH
ncbi:hypothetical protein BJ741DRAFT_599770 [Chytriomyces cf. hyalinus JEL632]|nr:hypothetical protein BJ741DRAFT_599770 [Chytriomyces cf. hyalinus JEL632]